MTLHAYELATLVAAARWVVEGTQGELTSEAIDQLRKVLASYDRASASSASRQSGTGTSAVP
jgi:hypothetical protein